MKLYVGNLPFGVSEEEFKNLFSNYPTEEVVLIINKFSGRSKGFGFVTITDEEMAKKFISEFNGKDIQGRPLKVSEAVPIDPNAERPRRFNRRRFGGGRRPFRRSRPFDGNRSRKESDQESNESQNN
ncbi:RNA-binding protein [Candidatus Woesearchaeota archaeon]|nr:RNA-binding protein [Candidatus Woesearchaeota archaeon]